MGDSIWCQKGLKRKCDAADERGLVQCLELPEGTTKEDIPRLAAEMAARVEYTDGS